MSSRNRRRNSRGFLSRRGSEEGDGGLVGVKRVGRERGGRGGGRGRLGGGRVDDGIEGEVVLDIDVH